MATDIIKKRFTVEEYHRMAEAGILGQNDRVELIDGDVVQMSPIGRRHRVRVLRATTLFNRVFGDRALVGCQTDLKLNEWTEPQPDIFVLKPRNDFYAARDWAPEDVFFVMEISDSSLRYDREVKVPLFAVAGIPEVWVEDTKNDVLYVYRHPERGAYAVSLALQRRDIVAPIAFPGVQFSVDNLFGDPVSE